MTGGAASDGWTREALRLNARYVEEIVVGWGLCPWAAQAWRAGAVARRVVLDRALDPAPVLACIDAWSAEPGPQIGLVIWPRAPAGPAAFGRFAEELRRDRTRRPPPFLIAAFHPQLRERPPADAASLVPFIRRTPDPTLQLVRSRLLDDLARGDRDVSGDVARANFAAVAARGPEALDRALRDIHRDRDDSYARLERIS